MKYSNINDKFIAHLSLIEKIQANSSIQRDIQSAIKLISKQLKKGQCIHFCGNGGSAADAAHLAAELSGRYLLNRAALHAEALHTNGAAITAISNDFGYKDVFSRLLEAKAKPNDILYLMTTSGQSENIKRVLNSAIKMDLSIIALTGKTKTTVYKKADIHIKIPSDQTPRIQEAMMLIGHIICCGVESKLFA